MAKFEIKLPFYVREALTVAQSVAGMLWKPQRDAAKPLLADTMNSLPTPIEIKASTNDPETSVQDYQKSSTARVKVDFGGGMVVTGWMVSWTSPYGEHWALEKISARHREIVEGIGPNPEKTERVWQGSEIDEISMNWGYNPDIWKDPT